VWHDCNADTFKRLQANYMLIRLLCAHSMTKYIGKISLGNSKWLLRILRKKILVDPFFVDEHKFRGRSTYRNYTLLKENLTWLQALLRCSHRNPTASLMFIQSSGEQARIRRFLSGEIREWLLVFTMYINRIRDRKTFWSLIRGCNNNNNNNNLVLALCF